MARIAALAKTARFAQSGSGLRSRAILFALALINQLGFHRTYGRAAVARFLISCADPDGVIRFVLRLPRSGYRVTVRAGDFADYQSAWECLSGTMYRLPSRPVKYLIDAGANIGLFSLHAAGQRDIAVLAIEPSPANMSVLTQNLAAIPGARKLEAALSARDGTAAFMAAASNAGHLAASGEAGPSFEVRTVRLASIIPAGWELSDLWLKLDIEGVEYDVLRDMLQAGIKPAVISAEIHDYFGAGGAALIAEVESAGYTVTVEGSGDSGNVCRQIHAELGTLS
jgi:FkbM family methyltransferase